MTRATNAIRAGSMVAVAAASLAVGGCGSGNQTPSSAQKAASSIQVTQAPSINEVDLATGSDQQQITKTIRAFYKATWQDDASAACSLFSPAGLTGFMQSAKVAFPDSINAASTCPDAMRFFNADLADSASQLQQSGVNISGNVLEVVGVKDIKVEGNAATAQAPEGVEEFIQPKTFTLVRHDGRWLINGSHKIGQTLAQLLAEAKAKHELVPGLHGKSAAAPPPGAQG
ncbi:MAG TPA: hypothetical protein VG223_00355 [Solirubrobacteraceae bacterium]|nr:hypothetical protein [Solirubrobacteraceae bacterium]